MREKVLLICKECLSRNYVTTLPREREKSFEVYKFCKRCNKKTLHTVSK